MAWQHPFDCSECAQLSKNNFTIFQDGIVDDWLIAYPEQRSIHVHFGYATTSETENIAEAKFVQKFLLHCAAQYLAIQFFLFVDASRGDNSEFIPSESMHIYKTILNHPQLQHGVFYGGTTALQYIFKLLLHFSKRDVKIVSTKAEADQCYQAWLNKTATT